MSEQHRAEIVDDFLSRVVRVECSCGWVSDDLATHDRGFRLVQQDALALHAAHVADAVRGC